jgi:hypothetical protein
VTNPPQSSVKDLIAHLATMVKLWTAMRQQHPPSEKWSSIEQLILEQGRVWKSQPYSGFRGTKKACFKNATHMAMYGGETYVEGIALGKAIIPIHHAWCIDKQGLVIDSTWERPEQTIYCGIPFKTAFVLETTLKHGHYGLLGNHTHHFEIERGLIPVETWLEKSVLDLGSPINLPEECVQQATELLQSSIGQ